MMQCSVEAAKVVTRLNLDVVFKSIRPLGKHGGARIFTEGVRQGLIEMVDEKGRQ